MTDTLKTPPKIDAKFLIERSGKPFILFAGLMDLAHQQGLRRIETKLLQTGSEENGMTWLFRAEVETERGVFTGHADANPTNVGRQMLTVLPRMAETRSIARALRFATNVGMAALEELGEETEDSLLSSPPVLERRDGPMAVGAKITPIGSREEAADVASTNQISACFGIGRDVGYSSDEIKQMAQTDFGRPIDQLSKAQASKMITKLRSIQSARQGVRP